MNGPSIHLHKKGDHVVSALLPNFIFTQNLPRLQRFYLAFAGGYTASQDDKKCVLCLGNKQYIVLVDQERDSCERGMRHPQLDLQHTDQGTSRTKRLLKTVVLNVASVEALLISYGRIKGQGIVPVQTSLDGTKVMMRFEDPDGNVVKLCSDFPSSADCSDLMGKNGSSEGGRSIMNVNPDVLMERLQFWRAELEDS